MHNNQKNQKLTCKQTINPDKYIILPPDISKLMNKPDLFTTKKKDLMTTAGILNGKAFGFQQDIFIKRFAPRSFSHFLLRKIIGSRARHNFKLSVKLIERGLPAPLPVRYIEPTFRARHAFYISFAIEKSEDLAAVLINRSFRESQMIASLFAETLARWHMEGAVHGDLKWPNILLQEEENGQRFFFVDLDQAKLYDKPNIKGIIKDLLRFYRAGLEFGKDEWVNLQFFPEYMAALPDEIKKRIDLDYIKNKAVKEWDRKGQTRY